MVCSSDMPFYTPYEDLSREENIQAVFNQRLCMCLHAILDDTVYIFIYILRHSWFVLTSKSIKVTRNVGATKEGIVYASVDWEVNRFCIFIYY